MTAIVFSKPLSGVWYWLGWVCPTTPEVCWQSGTDAEFVGLSVAAFRNISSLAGSSGSLPGWPRNNASHLEAASPGSELSDGWGDLSRMSSWACRQGRDQSPPSCPHWRGPTPTQTFRSRVLSRHLQLLTLVPLTTGKLIWSSWVCPYARGVNCASTCCQIQTFFAIILLLLAPFCLPWWLLLRKEK